MLAAKVSQCGWRELRYIDPGQTVGACCRTIETAQQVLLRHAAIAQKDLAGGRVVHAHLAQGRAGLEPRRPALDDDGETLKLLRPGNPELDGTVPYYRVDHVSYRTNAPWSQPAIGASLERMPLQSFGNDPANWRASPFGGTPAVPVANRLPWSRYIH